MLLLKHVVTSDGCTLLMEIGGLMKYWWQRALQESIDFFVAHGCVIDPSTQIPAELQMRVSVQLEQLCGLLDLETLFMELLTPIITMAQIMNPNLNTITLHKGFGWMISIILFMQQPQNVAGYHYQPSL